MVVEAGADVADGVDVVDVVGVGELPSSDLIHSSASVATAWA